MAKGFVGAVALVVAACASDSADPPVTVRDSVGITIVEHAADAVSVVPEWTIVEEPELDLGVVDGDPAFQFYQVFGGLRLDDGRIVIANGGSADVRVFRPDGSHLLSVGRKGEGPGEFNFPWTVWRVAGDSIAVYDYMLKRLTLFSNDFAFGRVALLSPALLNAPTPLGTFSNGDLLLYDPIFDIPDVGFDTIWAYAHRYGLDGAVVDTLGRYSMGVMGRYEQVSVVGGPAFQPRTVVAVAGDGLVVGPADDYRLHFLDPAGGLRRIARWHDEDLAVTSADMEAYRTQVLARARDDNARRRAEARLASQPVSKSFPAYEALIADRAGNLWMRGPSRPSRDEPAHYTILRDGRMVARAELPAGLRPLDIGANYLLGVVTDELDVEHVVLHRLVRAGA
jgi:hypothetical protein